jgi:hypothetical protein
MSEYRYVKRFQSTSKQIINQIVSKLTITVTTNCLSKDASFLHTTILTMCTAKNKFKFRS